MLKTAMNPESIPGLLALAATLRPFMEQYLSWPTRGIGVDAGATAAVFSKTLGLDGLLAIHAHTPRNYQEDHGVS
jgi:hypothetical protein